MKLRLTLATNSPNTIIRVGEYAFTYDKKLKAIPVDVPEGIAETLLQMTQREHSCCKNKKPLPLFEEVA